MRTWVTLSWNYVKKLNSTVSSIVIEMCRVPVSSVIVTLTALTSSGGGMFVGNWEEVVVEQKGLRG